MDDLTKYINKRKSKNDFILSTFDEGYENFKIGVLLKQTRIECGLTQEEVATIIKTKKSAISRIENHAENISLLTLEKFASALGKQIKITLC